MRLLACDLSVDNGLYIPAKQVGSSIMPGKINPVIPEFVISCCHRVYANDSLIAGLAAQGCLELNAYIPVIGHALLESLKLLIACNVTLKDNLIDGIAIDEARARECLLKSPSVTTALVPYVGYHEAGRLAAIMKQEGISIVEANRRFNIISERLLDYLLQPSNLLQLGFMPSQITEEINRFRNPDDKPME
jgi:aspartate ammonia-lyase